MSGEVAAWLRRWTANPMSSARGSSNPILVVSITFLSLYENEMSNILAYTLKRVFHQDIQTQRRELKTCGAEGVWIDDSMSRVFDQGSS